MLAVLANDQAPKVLRFDLELPEGGVLTPQEDGSISVHAPIETQVALPGEEARIDAAVQEILGDTAGAEDPDSITEAQYERLAEVPDVQTESLVATQQVAEIAAPWAVDADGNAVPTLYEIAGDTLVQKVRVDASTTFPVVADPSFDWVWWPATAAACVAAVGTLIAAGYAKVAVGVGKLVVSMRAAKSSSKLGKAYTAWQKLGTSNKGRFNTLASQLKTFGSYVVKHLSSGPGKYKKSSTKAAATYNFVMYSARVGAAVFGITKCFDLIDRL